MPDQLREIVSRMVAAGEPEENIAAVIQRMSVPDPTTSTEKPERTWGQVAADTLPTVGGLIGSLAGGSKSTPMGMALAGAGGAAGEGYRQLATHATELPGAVADVARNLIRQPAATLSGAAQGAGEGLLNAGMEGGKQAAAEGVGRLISGLVRTAVAKPLYKGAIPKAIQDKFAGVDLAGAGLDSGVLLGTERGAATAAAAKSTAAKGIEAAAGSVPGYDVSEMTNAIRPIADKAVSGRVGSVLDDAANYITQASGDIGPTSMSGAEQLARKSMLEQAGKAAMTNPNPALASINPQLANAERAAIAANLRRAPEMAKALDATQAAIGVQRAAKATMNSSILNRLRAGGLTGALSSPAGMAGTALAAKKAGELSPQALRALALMQLLTQDQQ